MVSALSPETLAAAASRADPLADDAMATLCSLPIAEREAHIENALAGRTTGIEELDRLATVARSLPVWVEPDLLNRGGRAYLELAMPMGITVLSALCLPAAYCSPVGNKPLALSGRLQYQASKRLFETARFVMETSAPDGLLPDREGHRITFRVRLVHARVRWMLARSESWSSEWGVPINQRDMLGTNLLFGAMLLDGLRRVGVAISEEESYAVMHLWRVSGWLMGIDEELLAVTEPDGMASLASIFDANAPPDEDSRMLTHALLSEGYGLMEPLLGRRFLRWHSALLYSLSRELLGAQQADQLALPPQAPWFSMGALRGVVAWGDRFRRRVPGGHAVAWAVGHQGFQQMIRQGLRSERTDYSLPSELRGTSIKT